MLNLHWNDLTVSTNTVCFFVCVSKMLLIFPSHKKEDKKEKLFYLCDLHIASYRLSTFSDPLMTAVTSCTQLSMDLRWMSSFLISLMSASPACKVRPCPLVSSWNPIQQQSMWWDISTNKRRHHSWASRFKHSSLLRGEESRANTLPLFFLS